MKAKIVHVASISLSEQTGMGRIACRWRDAFLARGYDFVHVGPVEVGPVSHPTLWARRAAAVVRKVAGPKLILAHEPGSGSFLGLAAPFVVFSHGVERRHDALYARLASRSTAQKMRGVLSAPLWRWRQLMTDQGMSRADLLLVSNREDRDYCLKQYRRTPRAR